MPDLRSRTALQNRPSPAGLAIGLREIPDRGMIDLRGLASDHAFLDAAKAVLEVDLPLAPRTTVSWGDIKVLWRAEVGDSPTSYLDASAMALSVQNAG